MKQVAKASEEEFGGIDQDGTAMEIASSRLSFTLNAQTWLVWCKVLGMHNESDRIGNLVLATWDVMFAFNDEPRLCELTRIDEYIY